MAAITQNSPPVGTIKKLPNGKRMRMTIRGWETINPVLDEQNKAKTKAKKKAKEESRQKAAEKAVKDLRKNNNGKAGLPRTNTAP